MDDPLSALDAGTAKQVFSRLIKSPSAFFSNTAVLLVTHASHFLNRVDAILVVVDGAKKFLGTWDELTTLETHDPRTQSAVEFIRNSVQEGDSTADKEDSSFGATNAVKESMAEKPTARALMTVEEREHGLSSLKTWLLWFAYSGGVIFLGILVLLMVGDRFAYVATEYWLARWTAGAYDAVNVFGVAFPPQTEGRSAQYQYLTVYAIILLVSTVFTILR
jgi:ABC-type sulfate/molybdate transport systems ATPase subunit